MAHCEDFPACGHELGDCPDAEGRMKCVDCGAKLKKNASSSICDKCLKNYQGFDTNEQEKESSAKDWEDFIED